MSNPDSTEWVALDHLECGEAWIEGEDTICWGTNRLFDPTFPYSTGIDTDRSTAVFVEVDPGNGCERHAHEVEEFIVVNRGTLEVTVADRVTTEETGQVTVIPPDAPHGFRTVGDHSRCPRQLAHEGCNDVRTGSATDRPAGHGTRRTGSRGTPT